MRLLIFLLCLVSAQAADLTQSNLNVGTLKVGSVTYLDDPDVTDWISRVVAQGSTVSAGDKAIANAFARGLRYYNLRSKGYDCGIYLGDTLAALNVKAGTVGLGYNRVCNVLASTTGLDALGALRAITPVAAVADIPHMTDEDTNDILDETGFPILSEGA